MANLSRPRSDKLCRSDRSCLGLLRLPRLRHQLMDLPTLLTHQMSTGTLPPLRMPFILGNLAQISSSRNASYTRSFSRSTINYNYNDERQELWINEINNSKGYVRLRPPEQYFYFLTGGDAYARHTADYWRAFFNIPLPTRHFENSHHPGHINYTFQPPAPSSHPTPTPTPTPSSSTPSVATLAAQLQEQLFSWPINGPIPTSTASAVIQQMSIEQLQSLAEALQTLASSSPSELTETSAMS